MKTLLACGAMVALTVAFLLGVNYGRGTAQVRESEVKMVGGWPAKVDSKRGTVQFMRPVAAATPAFSPVDFEPQR